MARKRSIRWILLAFLAAVGGTMAFYLALSPRYGIQVRNISVFGPGDADLQIDRIHVVQNSKGRKDWELWADSAKVYREKNVTHLQNLHLRLFQKNGKVADVTADRGIMENRSRNMEISGHVVVRTPDGQRLRTESLRFRPKEKQIDTEARVLLEGDAFELSGVGLHGQTDLGRYLLRDKVRAVIYPEKLSAASRPGTPVPSGGERDRGNMP